MSPCHLSLTNRNIFNRLGLPGTPWESSWPLLKSINLSFFVCFFFHRFSCSPYWPWAHDIEKVCLELLILLPLLPKHNCRYVPSHFGYLPKGEDRFHPKAGTCTSSLHSLDRNIPPLAVNERTLAPRTTCASQYYPVSYPGCFMAWLLLPSKPLFILCDVCAVIPSESRSLHCFTIPEFSFSLSLRRINTVSQSLRSIFPRFLKYHASGFSLFSDVSSSVCSLTCRDWVLSELRIYFFFFLGNSIWSHGFMQPCA